MLGARGCARVAENAVLNANYLKALVEGTTPCKYPRRCMHEFVAQGDLAEGVHTLDVAKRLIDYGFHPPTIYFPLIVPEALMIEPTETEAKETLDEFAAALLKIAEEARTQPSLLPSAPTTTPMGRLDEVGAARNPVLCYRGLVGAGPRLDAGFESPIVELQNAAEARSPNLEDDRAAELAPDDIRDEPEPQVGAVLGVETSRDAHAVVPDLDPDRPSVGIAGATLTVPDLALGKA